MRRFESLDLKVLQRGFYLNIVKGIEKKKGFTEGEKIPVQKNEKRAMPPDWKGVRE